MARPRKSTTPVADEKRKLYDGLFALHAHKEVTRDNLYKERCPKCGSRYQFVMSEYAIWFGSDQNLMNCGCGRLVWFKVISEGDK